MKKWISIGACLCMLAALALAGGCSGSQGKTEDKIRDLEFTVMDPEELPEELSTIIEENKKSEIKMTYESEKYLYLIRGFGEQKTGGYSIQVDQCYLTKDGIRVHTNLLGPDHEKKIAADPSYPFVVIKLQYMEEAVTFL